MDKNIKDKVVVVTGGAEGLGYAFAESYLDNGAKTVILLDINQEKGVEAANNLNTKYGTSKASFISCDVTRDLEAVSKNIFETYKKVDVLVNNAGIVDEMNAKRVIDINVVSLVEWSLKFREHMRKDKGGQGGTIVNVGSGYSYMIDPFLVLYKTTKFAVMGFSRSLGHEFNYNISGVRVYILCPGFAYSKLTNDMTPWEEQKQAFEEFTGTCSWQTPETIAKANIDIFKKADSGTAWSIMGGEVEALH